MGTAGKIMSGGLNYERGDIGMEVWHYCSAYKLPQYCTARHF